MDSHALLRRAVRCALYANAAAGLPALAIAQAAPPPAEQAEATAPVTEVVVTGSRIANPALQAISPVTTVSADVIKSQGTTRIEDMLNNLPQVVADQGSMSSNGASGTATVDLRGLGPQRTLVLINGRRLMPGTPSNTPTFAAPDLNNIPAALTVWAANAVVFVMSLELFRRLLKNRLSLPLAAYRPRTPKNRSPYNRRSTPLFSSLRTNR